MPDRSSGPGMTKLLAKASTAGLTAVDPDGQGCSTMPTGVVGVSGDAAGGGTVNAGAVVWA